MTLTPLSNYALTARLEHLAKELEYERGKLESLEHFMDAQIRSLEAENEALRDLLYELGITDPNPLDMSVGAVLTVRQALETAGVLS